MFAYRFTPLLGLVFAVLIAAAVVTVIESPDRPLTTTQLLLFLAASYLPGLGLAMLIDPRPRAVRASYLKINFYEASPHKLDPQPTDSVDSCKSVT